MTLAILCSGQGRQHPDMFALTGVAPEAAGLFAHASRLLGSDVRAFVRSGTSEIIHSNRAGQILCTVQALAAAATLGDVMSGRIIVAGYSVGEVGAWGAAGLFAPADTLDLVARRAEVMDAVTSPGDGLLFVRGLSRSEIDGLCGRHGADVAIVNPGGAFVLGGSGAALETIADEARAMRAARIVRLPVAVASHTKKLIQASAAFRQDLRQVRASFPRRSQARVLSGIDGSPVLALEPGLDKLAAQISQTLQWASCLQGCIEAGATAFLELGPGHALSDMVVGAWSNMPSRALDDFRSLEGLRVWFSHHVGG